MKTRFRLLIGGLVFATMQSALAENGTMTLPRTVEAGNGFSIQTTGSGKAVLYIVGLGQVLKRDVQLGQPASFPAGDLHDAGHYIVLLTGDATDNGALDVVPANQPASLGFLAKPSRLPVGLHDGISGAVYVFDAFQNLITAPTPVNFQLSGGAGGVQARTVVTRNGDAWTEMDSSAKESEAQFVAKADGVSSTRIIEQVPGDPCGLRMSAKPAGEKIELETDPIRDCGGNAVPEGTIVTFTELYNGTQTTVDVPIKRGIARAEVPAYNGARLSVATGVVMGNDIRWGKQ
jgi:hypothetical protein